MAYIHGTVVGHAALYAKLLEFLTTNAELVAANQAWEVVWESSALPNPINPTDKLLRGPGLADQDQVYVATRAIARPLNDQHWIEFRGATGPVASANTYDEHIKSQPAAVRIFTDSGTIEYWMVANGRRFAMVLKISTIFECMYAGLFLPYASPLSYPYPLMVGGSAGPDGQGASVFNWRQESIYHTNFVTPNGQMGGGNQVDTNLWTLDPMGQWVRANSGTEHNILLAPRQMGSDWFGGGNGTSGYNAQVFDAHMIDAYGGGRLLNPVTLHQRSPSIQTYGIMDGVFTVAGVANAAENIIQAGGVDHLVVQNVFRTTFFDYWALALE